MSHNNELENLIKSGAIKSYVLRNRDMDGNLIKTSGEGSRETEEIVLFFPSGETLTIGTFCSGSRENTCLIFNPTIDNV